MDLLFFLHMPRTGGTAVNAFLFSRLSHEKIFPYQFWAGLLKPDTPPIQSYNLLTGHFDYTALELLPTPIATMTFVRDPVARAFSHYRYQQEVDDPRAERLKDYRSLGIRQLCQKPEYREELLNYQTRMLSRDIDIPALSQKLYGKAITPQNVLSDHSPEVDIEKAMRRLSNFSFVGITERLTESVELFCQLFDWAPPPTPIPFENITKQLPIKDEEIRYITEGNDMDIELYQHAIALYEQQKRKIEGGYRIPLNFS